MKYSFRFKLALCATLAAFLASCGTAKSDPAAGAPPPAQVEQEPDLNVIQVDHPEQYPTVAAIARMATSALNVTGAVSPDISRQLPVPSLATGRITEIDARLGDAVKKGQLLFKVQSSDVSGAYADYRKAVKDEQLTKLQLNRAQLLFDHGAAPQSSLEIAQNAEDDAAVQVDATTERIHLMGLDPEHPSGIVSVYAPMDGVITDQQITNQSGVQALTAPNPFTISDMSSVWILCDVHENDLPQIHTQDFADIRLNAYPNRVFKGRVDNIGAILDPTLRTAKVRIQVANSGGIMRLGMFVTATFHGQTEQMHVAIPATAILHLHDRDWVFVPAPNNKFQRLEIASGITLPGNLQEVTSGIQPGAKVVIDALSLENTADQ
jgi:cobalt-zinc-cadmium efflux system membrane fusion protein